MNVGYLNCSGESALKLNQEATCPLCGSDIYMNKYGTDYKCMNASCDLSIKASELVKRIWGVLEGISNVG